MKLVYCAGGNRHYMETARGLGWHTGARSDHHVYPVHRPLYLLDAHWVGCDWARHLRIAREERPALCSVPDILARDGLETALAQAQEVAPYCDEVLIIPKVDAGLLAALPRQLAGRRVILGYSVPSRYGATCLPLWLYKDWPVHLLGGMPRRQVQLAAYLNVVSAGGNVSMKLAHRGVVINERAQSLPFDDGRRGEPGMPARCLAASLAAIPAIWARAGYTVDTAPAAAEKGA